MTVNRIEAAMEPEPDDEHYRPGRVERLKRWLSPDFSANRR